MNFRLFAFLAIVIFLPLRMAAQHKVTLSGYVRDGNTGEDMTGAKVSLLEAGTGGFTNEYGFYSISVPPGKYTIVAHYLGFQDDTLSLELNSDITHHFELETEAVNVKVVEITDKREDENVKGMEMGSNVMDVKLVKKLPALMGEVDVIRTIQLLPGVQPVGEGITGYYVRGGQSNHNLIVLDEAPVYNASHVLGFFSVFNSDALKDEYKLYKGGIPAEYGGRLASVLDLRMKEGNSKQFHATGGVGLISSRLTLEAPIIKDKSSFMVSGRRTYGDLFLLLSKKEDLRQTRAYFYDVNAKINYKISEKDRLFLSGYFGRDVFKFREAFSNDWGNATATLRWNHVFNNKLFANTTFVVSDFFYGFEAQFIGDDRFKYGSGIRDYNVKVDFDWFANPKNKIKFGINSIFHQFNPGQFEPIHSDYLQKLEMDPTYALENGIYFNNEQELSNRWSLLYGLRYSAFEQLGPGTVYDYASDGETKIDSTEYSFGEIVKHYGGLEPRLAVRYMLDANSSLKGSYNRMRQYLHQASNSMASFPWDIWVASSKHIPPEIGDQVALGYFRNFHDNMFEGSIEAYYKWMYNQLDFKNGAELILNPTLETELLYGSGYSTGLELFVKKNSGRLTGWIGYTLSRTRRTIDGINEGREYAANSDRRHNANLVANYQITRRLNASAIWTWYTGAPITLPIGKYEVEGHTVFLYGDRNSHRMPDYHRLDLSVNIDPKPQENPEKRKLESSWNFSVYNAYGRRNAWAITVAEKEGPNGTSYLQATKLYLFRWVPSITWNFTF